MITLHCHLMDSPTYLIYKLTMLHRRIVWQTKKIRSLFPLKDRTRHRSCIIYKGVCSCGKTYIGETDRNASARWKEHDTPSSNSEPAKHKLEDPTHNFEWEIITSAPTSFFKRKILEDYYIAKLVPEINEQTSSNILKLFRYGVT